MIPVMTCACLCFLNTHTHRNVTTKPKPMGHFPHPFRHIYTPLPFSYMLIYTYPPEKEGRGGVRKDKAAFILFGPFTLPEWARQWLVRWGLGRGGQLGLLGVGLGLCMGHKPLPHKNIQEHAGISCAKFSTKNAQCLKVASACIFKQLPPIFLFFFTKLTIPLLFADYSLTNTK